MLDVLGCAIGCVFDGTADAGAARFGFCANGGDLLTPLGGLFFGILTAKFSNFGALLFLSTSPLLGSHRFAGTFDGIVRVGEAGGVLAVLTCTAVFAIALGLTSAGFATRIKAREAERAFPRAVAPGVLDFTDSAQNISDLRWHGY